MVGCKCSKLRWLCRNVALALGLLYGFGMKRTFGYGLSVGVVWAALALACSASPGEGTPADVPAAASSEVAPVVAPAAEEVEAPELAHEETPPVKRGTFDQLEPMCTALLERGLSADIE